MVVDSGGVALRSVLVLSVQHAQEGRSRALRALHKVLSDVGVSPLDLQRAAALTQGGSDVRDPGLYLNNEAGPPGQNPAGTHGD